MNHPPSDPSFDLEVFREYLRCLARSQLPLALAGKVDLSGVVQQTLLEAFQAGDRFPRGDRAKEAAWLRKALTHNLIDEVRKCGGRGREPVQELSLEQAIEHSSARLEDVLRSEEPTPATQAARAEQGLRLADGLARLPVDQRQAIELHHLRGLSLEEAGVVLGRSREAVAGLVFRGMKRLREVVRGEEAGDERPRIG